MKTTEPFPSFDEQLAFLHVFICQLVNEYKEGGIRSWDDLEIRVKTFFTPDMMDRTNSFVPHWGKMASYGDGFTLVHVMCVFLGLYMMPEFLALSREGQQLMKWVILFHDVEKELQEGKRDHFHAFRSTIGAARILPKLGFPITAEYDSHIEVWDLYTRSAVTHTEDSPDELQDNNKLPMIIDGIERMFGHNTSATLILKTILFHLSVPTNDWPPPNPLTKEEVIRYLDRELLPLLKVMNLGDTDGWALFDPETRDRQRLDTLQVFERFDRVISSSGIE